MKEKNRYLEREQGACPSEELGKDPGGSGPGAEPSRLSWLVGRGASILPVEAGGPGREGGARGWGNCSLASVCGAQQASGRSCGSEQAEST